VSPSPAGTSVSLGVLFYETALSEEPVDGAFVNGVIDLLLPRLSPYFGQLQRAKPGAGRITEKELCTKNGGRTLELW